MIRTFSLQPALEQNQNKSFYAFGDHKPPPRYPRNPHRPDLAQARVASQNSRVQSALPAAKSNQPKQKDGERKPASSGLRRKSGQSGGACLKRAKLAKGNNGSPVLSEHRTRSHFGASTQMIIEDGTGSQALPDGTPMTRNEPGAHGGFPTMYDFQSGLNQANSLAGVAGRQKLRSVYETRPSSKGMGKPLFKQFNRQMTSDYTYEHEAELQAVAEAVSTQDRRGRSKQGSFAQDTLQENSDSVPKQTRFGGNQLNSAEQLGKHEGSQMLEHQMQASAVDTFDQVSEVKRMELHLESLKLSKLQSLELKVAGLQTSEPLSSPPLNVILPPNVQTGFKTRIEKELLNQSKLDYSVQCEGRVRTAQPRKRKPRGSRSGHGAQGKASEVVQMNEKQMTVASGATNTGIVSLYNKGFVPKTTGKLTRKSNFRAPNKQLYQTQQDKEGDLMRLEGSQPESQIRVQRRSPDSALRPEPQSLIPVGSQDSKIRVLRSSQPKEEWRGRGNAAANAKFSGSETNASYGRSTHGEKMRVSLEYQTALHRAQGKNPSSVEASEIVLPRESETLGNDVADQGSSQGENQMDSRLQEIHEGDLKPTKGQFKLPSTEDVRQREQLQGKLKAAESRASNDPSNGDQDSRARQLTDADEAAQSHETSTPLVTKLSQGETSHLMQPINLQDNQVYQADLGFTQKAADKTMTDSKETSEHKMVRSGAQKQRTPQGNYRVRSASRKSIPSKQSNERQDRLTFDSRPPMQPNAGLRQGLASAGSRKAVLNKDLPPQRQRTEPKDSRLEQNYSHTGVMPCSYSSFLHKKPSLSPLDSSMSAMAGKSLQSRALIGSQLVKNLVAQQTYRHSSLKEGSSQQQRRACSSSQHSSGQQTNKLIHLEIASLNKQALRTEQLNVQEEERMRDFEQTEQNANRNQARDGGETSNGLAVLAVSARNMNRIESIEQALNTHLKSTGMPRGSLAGQFQSDAVLVSDHQLQHAHTLEKLAASQSHLLSQEQAKANNQTQGALQLNAQSQKPNASIASLKTHQLEQAGKIKHVFLVNQTSREKIQSGRALQPSAKRSKDGRRRKRRKRPSSSRLRKRSRAFQFDLVNEKLSNGEDIATVVGGSTSRRFDQSERASQQSSDDAAESGPFPQSSPNNRGAQVQDLFVSSHRSQLPNFHSSTNQEESRRILIAENDSKEEEVNCSSQVQECTIPASLAGPVEEQFTLEGHKMSTMQIDASVAPQTANFFATGDSRVRDTPGAEFITSQARKLQTQTSVHHSINDYLQHEELQAVQILDARKSAFISTNQLTSEERDHVASQNNLNVPLSTVTIYKEPKQRFGGKSGIPLAPSSANQGPTNTGYSHMSAQRGTGSIEVSLHADVIKDPKLQLVGKVGEGFVETTFLASPALEQPVASLRSLGEGQMRKPENQMMVVTKIIVKPEREATSLEPASLKKKTTVDFDQQVDVSLLPEYGHPFMLEQPAFNFGEPAQFGAQGIDVVQPYLENTHEINLHMQAAHRTMSLATQQNQLAGVQGHSLVPSQQSPDLNKLGAESLTMNSQPTFSHQQSATSPQPPLALAALIEQSPNATQEASKPERERASFSLVISSDATGRRVSTVKAANQPVTIDLVAPSSRSPAVRHQLNSTNKQMQLALTSKLSKSWKVKQDDLLTCKERRVFATTTPSVPEKTQFRKRSASAHRREQSLAIVGQQTHTITKQQISTFVQKNTDKKLVGTQAEFDELQDALVRQDSLNQVQGDAFGAPGTLPTEMQLTLGRVNSKGLFEGHERGLPINVEDMKQSNAMLLKEQQRHTGTLNGTPATSQLRPSHLHHMQLTELGQTEEGQSNKGGGAGDFTPLGQVQAHTSEVKVQPTREQLAWTQHERATSQELMPLKIIPVNQRRQPSVAGIGIGSQVDLQSPYTRYNRTEDGSDLLQLPARMGIQIGIGREEDQSPSPYVAMKGRLMSSANHLDASAKAAETQVDFSNRVSERIYLSSEQLSFQGTNSTKQMAQPNKDLLELADKPTTGRDKAVGNLALSGIHSAGIPTTQGFLKSTEEPFRVAQPQNPVENFQGQSKRGSRVEAVSFQRTLKSGQARNVLNGTALMQGDQLQTSPMGLLQKDDLRYSSASNLSASHQFSANHLQAAIPAKFDVKITKVGSQVFTVKPSQREVGDYQGAPPNLFMRNNSKVSQSLGLAPRLSQQRTADKLISMSSRLGSQEKLVSTKLKPSQASPSGISLAVETRNSKTGARKKIVKSAVQSTEYDQNSDHTQMEGTNVQKEPLNLTLDQQQEQYSAHKLLSDTSFQILNPRGGVGYQPDGTTTMRNSIQVTIGRVTQRQTSTNELKSKRQSLAQAFNLTQVEQEQSIIKVQKSKSKVYEALGNSLLQVGQKSLQQLGVQTQISYQQSFNKIKESVKRQEELKARISKEAQDAQDQGHSKGQENQRKAKRSLYKDRSQDPLLQAILEDGKPKRTRKKVRAKKEIQLTREGLKATQAIIDFESMQRNGQSRNEETAKTASGVFNLAGTNMSFIQSRRRDQRQGIEFTKKSSLMTLMAKHQRSKVERPNVPLPQLESANATNESAGGLSGKGTSRQGRMVLTSKRYSGAKETGQSRQRQGELNLLGTLNSHSLAENQQTISAMDNFEYLMEVADQNYAKQQGLLRKGKRAGSHSAHPAAHAYQYAQPATTKHLAREASSQQKGACGFSVETGPTRPVSSKFYASTKHSSNVATQLGFQASKNNLQVQQQNSQYVRSRPLTANTRRPILSGKQRSQA